jgi:hypothetical protein
VGGSAAESTRPTSTPACVSSLWLSQESEYARELLDRSFEAALPVSRACNHELNRLFQLAAPAVNLQQDFSHWLKYEPDEWAGLGHVGMAGPAPAACHESQLREPRRRPPGLPDRPLSNGRPRTRTGGFGEMFSLIVGYFCSTRGAHRGGAIG